MRNLLCTAIMLTVCSFTFASQEEILGPVIAVKRSIKVNVQECLKNSTDINERDIITCSVKNVSTAKDTDILVKGLDESIGDHQGCGAIIRFTSKGYSITAEDYSGDHEGRMSDCLIKASDSAGWNNKIFNIIVHTIK